MKMMDEIIPWSEWIELIRPFYPKGDRGRPPRGIEVMLRMYLVQSWFNLSDAMVEDAIYDSYTGLNITVISGAEEADLTSMDGMDGERFSFPFIYDHECHGGRTFTNSSI